MKALLFLLFLASTTVVAQNNDSEATTPHLNSEKNYYSFLDRKIENSWNDFSFFDHSVFDYSSSFSDAFSIDQINLFHLTDFSINGSTSFFTPEGAEFIDGYFKFENFNLGNLQLESISSHEFDFLGNLKSSQFSISFK